MRNVLIHPSVDIPELVERKAPTGSIEYPEGEDRRLRLQEAVLLVGQHRRDHRIENYPIGGVEN